jgi:flavin reductase (DIM6/NTAB) family NADH-FMN oxidoreductase RutF
MAADSVSFAELVSQLDYAMFIVTTAADDERAWCLVGFASQASIHPPRFLVGLSDKNRTTASPCVRACSSCTSSRTTQPASPSCSAARSGADGRS